MEDQEFRVLILAGGMGKRMMSKIPKVLHYVDKNPMLVKIINCAMTLDPKEIVIITPKSDILIKKVLFEHLSSEILNKIVYIKQESPMGTGHAVMVSTDHFNLVSSDLMILPGDVPLITETLLKKLYNSHIESKHLNHEYDVATLLTTRLDNPTGNGRILLDMFSQFVKIQEEKDCNPEQKLINLVNAGIYVFETCSLFKYLSLIENNNSQKEYYLTDIFEILQRNFVKINTVYTDENNSLLNVNSQDDLFVARKRSQTL